MLGIIIILFFVLQINLRLILVSGKTKEFLFSPSDSAGDIAQHVFENWPNGKSHYDVTWKMFAMNYFLDSPDVN